MRKNFRILIIPYLFLIPYLFTFIAFRFGPSIAGFFVSLTSWNIVGTPKFIGFSNYIELFNDPSFITSLINTLYFMVLTVPALIVLGLLIALLVDQNLKGRTITRTFVFMPYVIMSTVVGVIWMWIFDTHFGILNYYLSFFGIKPIAWLSSVNWAMPAVAITTIWWTVGFNMILFLAGLQDIPEELKEAARIDGASNWQIFWNVTFPLLRSTTVVVLMLTLINSFEVFDQVYVMTGGGPSMATLTVIQYMYFQAFQYFRLGYGSAVAYVVFAFLIVLVLIERQLLKKVGES
ncbi:carbohydrate ABC transporter permease [Athalassotoga saccharophila]|uniref:carbohydrate ABC transporter permease n=1 Tax=Athalassotoga saccharophila TaxID=1441386 RepID=UPI00137AF3BA|nr:sugar ABC transporter permease [Athalassotoga saccharophila]BBJ27491.1 L-arabinose transport system permease protein AraP [Athalassotoga saccharophila]